MICIYSNPETVCRISPESNTWVPMQAAAQTERPDSAWGRKGGGGGGHVRAHAQAMTLCDLGS